MTTETTTERKEKRLHDLQQTDRLLHVMLDVTRATLYDLQEKITINAREQTEVRRDLVGLKKATRRKP